MTASRDPDRLIRDFLLEGEEELQDQVYDAVRAAIEHRRQRLVVGPWRAPIMNRTVGFGLAAAAVFVALVVGTQLLGSPEPGGFRGPPPFEPSATAEPSSAGPTVAEPSPTPQFLLPAGSHVLWDAAAGGVPITVTLPAPDWYGEPGGGILLKHDEPGAPDGAAMIVFAESEGDLYVYGDPCQSSTTRPDTPSTTVDELVAALAAQPSRDASAPMDVTVGGYAGKSITLHVPDDAVFSDCDRGEFRTLVMGPTGARFHQDPGQIDKLWIVDTSGGLVVIDIAYYEGTPQAVVDEMEAIVESISFEE